MSDADYETILASNVLYAAWNLAEVERHVTETTALDGIHRAAIHLLSDAEVAIMFYVRYGHRV